MHHLVQVFVVAVIFAISFAIFTALREIQLNSLMYEYDTLGYLQWQSTTSAMMSLQNIDAEYYKPILEHYRLTVIIQICATIAFAGIEFVLVWRHVTRKYQGTEEARA